MIETLAFWIAPAPVVLRLIGLMPENGDPILYPIILIATIIDIVLIITFSILSTAMLAVLVGFRGYSAFSKKFRHWMGCSPSEYRKNNLGRN